MEEYLLAEAFQTAGLSRLTLLEVMVLTKGLFTIVTADGFEDILAGSIKAGYQGGIEQTAEFHEKGLPQDSRVPPSTTPITNLF